MLLRHEDSRLVTGRGRYTSDWNAAAQLHAFMLRSDRPHAEIRAIDVEPARALAGVHAVILQADLDAGGFKPLPWGVAFPGRGGEPMKKPRINLLATDRVRYVGEPIAMVIADTPAIAQDAAERIVIDYHDLPAVAHLADALKPGAPQIHADIPGNLAFDYEDGDEKAVAAAFAQAKYVTRLDIESQRLIGNPMEPRACLATYHAARDAYTVHCGTQGVNGMRNFLAGVSGVPPEKLEIIADDVGGSFGIRAVPYPEYCCAMLGARRLGRPVKWTGARSDTMMSDTHGRALWMNCEVAIDANGRFLAFRYEDFGDLGAYPGPFGAFIASKNLTITMGGVYAVPALYARVKCGYTNTTPVSAYRGAGRPDIAYAIERLVEQAAAEHGLDPIELRRKNHVTPAQMPYKTANGTTYDCGEFSAIMDEALRRADHAGFALRRTESGKKGLLRGIGVASWLEASGGGTAPKDEVKARFDATGALTLYGTSGASGQGHETSFTQIVAEGLGVSPAAIRYVGSDPHVPLVGNGSGGSRTLLGVGSAMKLLAGELIKNGLAHAARALEAAEADIEYAAGGWRVKGTNRGIGFFELAKRLAGTAEAPAPHPMDSTAGVFSGATFPNGCHVAEVEIDPATGVVRIVSYLALDDFGHVVSRALVDGQVHGGVMQGAGQVLGEQALYDAGGQLLTGTFMDYAMPKAGWLPEVRTEERPVNTRTNALGAKGVGESGCSGSLPAIMNAVMNALRPKGVPPLDMPVTPAKVWTALQTARS